ncbi:mandelate racemase [Phaeobacter sp. J2-8]|uniref:mandelate racemase n=1 Tax=Phaeobacter sp. J2-8 TaxID=2931394 RepID=UPI001FD15B42|nr:mandelate racemase [Phaeobacter sp. J2-8]MCJ7873566.1 mandelate racemase [Phaeobacter sp. J2-8]
MSSTKVSDTMIDTAPRFRVTEITFDERPVGLRIPFRYGAVTLRQAVQAVARVTLTFADGRMATGTAAELMAPKWFDKSPELTNDQNVEQLRRALALTRQRYLDHGAEMTAFGLHAAHDAAQRAEAATEGLNALVAGFGMALIDKAVIAALCTHCALPFATLVRDNLFGLTPATAPDLSQDQITATLATLRPAPTLRARHTIGQIDPLTVADLPAERRVNDGLPETLQAAIATWGLSAFKLKLSGDGDFDHNRLVAIAAILDGIPDLTVTLDGNEQFPDGATFAAFWHRITADPRLARLVAATGFVEQPIARATALSTPLGPELGDLAVEIDESDDSPDAFLKARDMGYRGISSKSCKGVYRALLNRVRVAVWNDAAGDTRYFMSAEDLSTPPGLALQQDLSLAATLGVGHIERNGHFYGDGTTGLDPQETQDRIAAFPNLYCLDRGRMMLRIAKGTIDLTDLTAAAEGYIR